MTVANHEASAIDFPGLQGIFDPKYRKVAPGWLGANSPYSGVMAEAVQTVAITSRVAAENLLAVGTKGHAGFSKRFGGVDLTIDAIMTDNANVSGAYGYDLADFDARLLSGFTLYTTNGILGKSATISGLYVNSISFTFNQNDNSSTSWSLVGDGVIYSGYSVAIDGAKGNSDYHCINPLTWDEVYILDAKNNVLLSGVQQATFTANFNRTDIYQIGQFTPYDRSVTYPHNVTVSLNTLANEVTLVNWWEKFVPSYDPMSDCGNGFVIKVRTSSLAGAAGAGVRDLIIASGLRPTSSTLNAAVGSNSTVSLQFEGTSLRF